MNVDDNRHYCSIPEGKEKNKKNVGKSSGSARFLLTPSFYTSYDALDMTNEDWWNLLKFVASVFVRVIPFALWDKASEAFQGHVWVGLL
ncbi:MAG: hypothetical protein V1894_07460 [Chloroflexota bacterium]